MISEFRPPTGPGVRWDGWIERGVEVPQFYDSLLGKLIVWAESRERCIKRMRRALEDLVIVGVPTSREFHQRVMREPRFVKGEIDIDYWEKTGKALMAAPPDKALIEDGAIAAAMLEHERRTDAPAPGRTDKTSSAWADEGRREGMR
jgi:acetyl-CoA carboxylase biotin carboxylase subunit